ncbi:hypothetical protein JCM3765_001649 [Sporobolomyces pararoseus]
MDSAPVPNVAFAGTACFQCFKPRSSLVNLHKCSSCRIVKYCSQECSVKDWRDHKSFCRSLQAIRSTLNPPPPLLLQTNSNRIQEIKQRRQVQRKVWLTEDELLTTALKRQATMLESKLLWREPRCLVCWDREFDVEKRKGEKSWRVCKSCKVVGFCSKDHEEFAKKVHFEVKDVEGRSQCESIQLSNEVDEFLLRQHLASSSSSTSSSPSLWVPNRILSTPQPLPSSWSEYLSDVSNFLPSPSPPLAEIYGVFLESLSPVFTILSALDRLDEFDLSNLSRLTLYLIDESLQTCSNWIPCLEELQHQLPLLKTLNLITVSPLPPPTTSSSASTSTSTSQLTSLTKLPMCPNCTQKGKSRTITHLESLPSKLEKNSLAISFNSSIALLSGTTDSNSNPNTFWSKTLNSLFNDNDKEEKIKVPLLLTSQTREEARDTIQALTSCDRQDKIEQVWKFEKNVWRGGWGRVEGWWGLGGSEGGLIEEGEEEDGEGIVWKNGWWTAVRRK